MTNKTARRTPPLCYPLLLLFTVVTLLLTPVHAFELSTEMRHRCLGVLIGGMQSDEFWPSMHAAEGLTLSGHRRAVTNFLTPKQADESDDQRRCGLARELARAGDLDQSGVMLDILRGDDPYGHVHAAESLYKVGWTGDSSPLQSAFKQTQNPRLRIMAAAALAKHEQGAIRDEAFALLRSNLANEADGEIFRLSAWVLARIGSAEDIPSIKSRLADAQHDSLTLAFLQHALAALGDPAGKRALLDNLESPDAAVRTYAAVFAGESKMDEAAPQLIRQLADDNLDARIRAAQALLQLSN